MYNLSHLTRLKAVTTLDELQHVIDDIAQEQHQVKIALLLPKSAQEENRENWLGAVSTAMTNWVQSDEVRHELEGEHGLLPLQFTAHDSNLPSGLIVSTSTPSYAAVWLVVEYTERALGEQDMLEYIALSRYIADAYHCIASHRKHLLTDRERQCMGWIAQGKTSWEVAQILGLTERTINFHIQNCIDKTNSVNRIQATAKCITNALIHLSH